MPSAESRDDLTSRDQNEFALNDRLTSRKYWEELTRDLKPVYTAVNGAAARAAFDELTGKWGQRYPAVIRLWDNAWNEFIPFLDYDVEIRKVICSTNSGPHRPRTGTMDHTVEASAQRVRHHLRRPIPGGRDLLKETAGNTVIAIGQAKLLADLW